MGIWRKMAGKITWRQISSNIRLMFRLQYLYLGNCVAKMSLSLENVLEFQQYLKEKKGKGKENVNRRAPTVDAEQLGLSCVTESNSNENGGGDFLVNLAIVQFVGPAPAGDPICEVAADEDNQEKSSKEVDLIKKQPFIWKEYHTLLLIDICKSHEHKFASPKYKKNHVWEAITKDIHKQGFFRTS